MTMFLYVGKLVISYGGWESSVVSWNDSKVNCPPLSNLYNVEN